MSIRSLGAALCLQIAVVMLGAGCAGADPVAACDEPDENGDCPPRQSVSDDLLADEDWEKALPPDGESDASSCNGVVTAHVVAIDQVYVYNRFESFNPAGMIYALRRDVVAADPSKPIGPGNAMLREGKRPRPLTLRANVGDKMTIKFTNWLAPEPPDGASPATRKASILVNGLQIRSDDSLPGNVGQNSSTPAAPGETRIYKLRADREGPFLMHSFVTEGGEGNGGQLVQGLFGAINVEPPGTVWYRSQVTAEVLAAATKGKNPDGTPKIDYKAEDEDGVPLLRIKDDDCAIVHGDLNAIIDKVKDTEVGTPTSKNQGHFREFTVLFHDELHTEHKFDELNEDGDEEGPFHGVRDGFGINYGAAGLGAELLANRKKIGPTKDCIECKFEEFFLSSWTNGDPAMNVDRDGSGKAIAALFPDDPSNVHHSYLGDPTRFRNIHAGPKETHVFHLHAHQWLKTPASDKSNYLDAQTIGPGSAFTYDINFGGGGNRNFTVGDAIFHCHLYPHFAQGMWELWRNHDVFEAGTEDRNLPDGEIEDGTPTPAVVPIPKRAMAPMPTYSPTTVLDKDGDPVTRPAFPGYPHYVAALAGHRAPQAPLDLAHDGGLQRHIVTSVPEFERPGPRGEFDVEIKKANIKLLPEKGTPQEKAAMDFHGGEFPGGSPFTTIYDWPGAAYPAFTPDGSKAKFVVNGQPPVPGAPFANPCPPDAPKRFYSTAYVEIDAVVNKEGWHDKQMRLTTLAEDVDDTLDGTRDPEPLFMRANSGDCVVYRATNLLPDALEEDDFQVFTPTDTVGQHIHLLKFDVTASDGAANGFNYEDGTFAAEEVAARIKAANELGGAFVADGTLDEGGARVTLKTTKNPFVPSAKKGAQTSIQRFWADPVASLLGDDRTLRTAFTHDHFSPSSHQQHGLYAALVIEPAGSKWRDPETGKTFGTRSDGGPTSFRADIILPGKASFREFNLAFADFALLYDSFDDPVNPPTLVEKPLPIAVGHEKTPQPEVISARDPGSMLINYRNEPIPLRIAKRQSDGTFKQRSGKEGDMHHVFSSLVHDDPFTPLLSIYRGDPVQIRLIQGAHEEQHVFSIHGRTWLKEPSDPDSGRANGQPIGISEHFEFILQKDEIEGDKDCEAGDYLYGSMPTDDLWNGMWGILRAHEEKQPDLKALPNFPPGDSKDEDDDVCAPDAPERSYTVHAITAEDGLPDGRLFYNEEHDLFDPDAILFIEDSHFEDVKSGARKPEPLVLRAAAGDCIHVELVNHLPKDPPKTPHWNYNPPITKNFNTNQVRSSGHVSLHPQLVRYDIRKSDGANVGNNDAQTVPPGGKRTYTWYAGGHVSDGKGGTKLGPIELGTINLRDMADVVNHGMHGAVGALVIEPRGASWVEDADTAAQATVTHKDKSGDMRSFRELVLVYQDEISLHSEKQIFQCEDEDLNCGTAIRNLGGEDDAEDTGHDGFNYRLEPTWARLKLRPENAIEQLNEKNLSKTLDSDVFGDPATPIFKVNVGDKMRLRVAAPSEHARQHAFTLSNAEWPHNPFEDGSKSRVLGPNAESFVIGTQGGISAAVAHDVVPLYGAGGKSGIAGDYLYRDQPSFQFTNGSWGLVRVGEKP